MSTTDDGQWPKAPPSAPVWAPPATSDRGPLPRPPAARPTSERSIPETPAPGGVPAGGATMTGDRSPRPAASPGPAGRQVRVRVVERFAWQRVHQQTGPWRRARSGMVLLVSALIIGAVVGGALSSIVWGLSVAIHHASTN
ncbi:hypothetical protein K6U06_12110 [Acidiferrimicrobium sp. IK]|uniref:hypothetical protein n=1 Tax=Acidiferrimicrobium sp. IK TaxID=2871700 RepID=UPI0021CB51E4|nr:hypothetical protein [Acidiferrimicrobium sp. IK]MCU4185109.1 hypothetical protein [Acidiferrimicrobium sp. IK]